MQPGCGCGKGGGDKGKNLSNELPPTSNRGYNPPRNPFESQGPIYEPRHRQNALPSSSPEFMPEGPTGLASESRVGPTGLPFRSLSWNYDSKYLLGPTGPSNLTQLQQTGPTGTPTACTGCTGDFLFNTSGVPFSVTGCYPSTLAKIGVIISPFQLAFRQIGLSVPSGEITISIPRIENAVAAGGAQLPGGTWTNFFTDIFTDVTTPLSENSAVLYEITISVVVILALILFLILMIILAFQNIISWWAFLLVFLVSLLLAGAAVAIAFSQASFFTSTISEQVISTLNEVPGQLACAANAAVCCYSGGKCCCGSNPSTCTNLPT